MSWDAYLDRAVREHDAPVRDYDPELPEDFDETSEDVAA